MPQLAVVSVFVPFAMTFAACIGQATPTEVPTGTPAAAATLPNSPLLEGTLIAPTVMPMKPLTADQIVAIVWQWSDVIETAPAVQVVVPDPENYTLASNRDIETCQVFGNLAGLLCSSFLMNGDRQHTKRRDLYGLTLHRFGRD